MSKICAVMIDAATPDFPFVAELPKRERSRLVTVWDRLAELRQVSAEHGQLLPPHFAAKLLDISPQRISELTKAGRFVRVEVNGHPFLTESSVVEYARSERKAGRPFKTPNGIKGCFQVAVEYAKGK